MDPSVQEYYSNKKDQMRESSNKKQKEIVFSSKRKVPINDQVDQQADNQIINSAHKSNHIQNNIAHPLKMTTLGYWDVKGTTQPIRDLLAYLNVEYIHKTYNFFKADEWFSHDKVELKIPFPNLPYLIDEDIMLTESSVIPVYLIKKYKRYDLLGLNEDGSISEKELRVAQVMNIALDLRNGTFEQSKEKLFNEKLSPIINKLVEFLGEKEFLFGNLTYADFIFYETLQYIKDSYPTTVLPTLYFQRFENLPGIKEYMASPNYIKQFITPF